MRICFWIGLWLIATLAFAQEPVVRPQIVARKPHDPEAFTQGLLIEGALWLESTGLRGESTLREVDRESGEVLRKVDLPEETFGEGLALLDGKLYQLSWQEGICRVWDRESFKLIAEYKYPGEGWGLTTDGKKLYMSDGTAVIRVMDPETFKELRRFRVLSEKGPVPYLNELEWVEGEIWANVFQSKWIVRFRPSDGKVLGFIDLRALPLVMDYSQTQDVLNGIARDPATGGIWVTGKLWKAVYQIEWPVAANGK
ncbi:glutaminyl-peptide cyclotransferase [Kiritimatiellota bacterium B12222]|nr:glutaminyl-peptide cyclotransferase [Kiritimatiellota bacterium B12222]